MKLAYTVLALAGAVAVLVTAAGCGGSSGGKKTHELTSPWFGDLRGVATEPQDSETNIAVDSWIHVFWPDAQYPPPRSFTVRLEKEERPNEWGAVHTVLRNDYSDPDGGSWWFEPRSYFSLYTWYRIVISDGSGDRVVAYFRTSTTREPASRSIDASPAAPGSRYRPAGAENAPPSGEEGALEHTIRTQP